MSFIFLVLLGLFLFGKFIYDAVTTNKKAFTKEELEQMHGQVIGKSRKEVDKIQKGHCK
mgnify:CR=1 FL=1